jgi:MoaA/NifB/PqqE/SkfB family radical SAM enzyme
MKPFNVAVILPQPHCNMYCNFCVTEDSFDRMTFQQGLDLLDHIRALGVKNVVIGGGEPFFWPHDIVRYCQEAKNRGFLVQVGTNGTLLPQGFEHISCIDRYVLPLESMDVKSHDAMRKFGESHHGMIMECLERLKKARKSLTLSTVITDFNKDDILELANFIREYDRDTEHVHAWHLYQFIPLGRGGKKNADILRVPQGVYDDIVSQLKARDFRFHIFKRSDMYHSQTVEFFWYEKGKIVNMGGLRN